MGQFASRTFGVVSRQVKMYDIERRAHKVISKEKPERAPMYPSTVKDLEQLKNENVSMEYITNKDENLDTFLKKVYVTSPDLAPPMKRIENLSKLPQDRFTDSDVSYGYSKEEEHKIPVGKVSLKQAMQLLNDHSVDPKIHSNEAIALKYKLDVEITKDILEHFKIFSVHIQKKKVDPDTLNEYEKLQDKVRNMTMYNAGRILNEIDPEKNKLLKSKDDEEEDDESRPKKENRW